jgi:lipopolysaccharide transport system ATP-binding protein
MPNAIEVEKLSKVYRIGEFGTGTLSLDFQRWLAKVRGKQDPYLAIGEVNDRSTKGGDLVYSLNNLGFAIEQGDAVGVIGRNGAGKSTLLKILSRVTYPTAGRIHIKGRVASLLEVGTGFHPELTGRENIYLNGAIMGMRRKEIRARLDEIIEFSGVERYIDTPVRRYSSGMYVRLAFAVAAHLESEILIVDEVLAVGDIEFQRKCIGKMNEVSKGDGRTVIFVSHNLSSINTLCNTGILLSEGQLIKQGSVGEVISAYKTLIDQKSVNSYHAEDALTNKLLLNARIDLNGQQPENTLNVNLTVNTTDEIKNGLLVIDIINSDSVCVFQSISSLSHHLRNQTGVVNLSAKVKLSGIVPDQYAVNIYLCNTFYNNIDLIKNSLFFEILDSPVKEKLTFDYKGTENGYIYPPTEITLIN